MGSGRSILGWGGEEVIWGGEEERYSRVGRRRGHLGWGGEEVFCTLTIPNYSQLLYYTTFL